MYRKIVSFSVVFASVAAFLALALYPASELPSVMADVVSALGSYYVGWLPLSPLS